MVFSERICMASSAATSTTPSESPPQAATTRVAASAAHSSADLRWTGWAGSRIGCIIVNSLSLSITNHTGLGDLVPHRRLALVLPPTREPTEIVGIAAEHWIKFFRLYSESRDYEAISERLNRGLKRIMKSATEDDVRRVTALITELSELLGNSDG